MSINLVAEYAYYATMAEINGDKNSAVDKLLKKRPVVVVINVCVDETGTRKHKLTLEHQNDSPFKRICVLKFDRLSVNRVSTARIGHRPQAKMKSLGQRTRGETNGE